ncbi:MAG: hypothetical protein ACRYFX_18665 [Janthinobacterium lividum]
MKAEKVKADHKVRLAGGQDAGTLHDIKQIQEIVDTMHTSDVLAALKAAR